MTEKPQIDKAITELLETLKLALQIIGHPDDSGSKYIAHVISKYNRS